MLDPFWLTTGEPVREATVPRMGEEEEEEEEEMKEGEEEMGEGEEEKGGRGGGGGGERRGDGDGMERSVMQNKKIENMMNR